VSEATQSNADQSSVAEGSLHLIHCLAGGELDGEQGGQILEIIPGVPPIKISLQAEPRDVASWLALARRLESAGFQALLMGDHPGSGASPWPALGAAAAVTTSL
jgi:hypothetical protein